MSTVKNALSLTAAVAAAAGIALGAVDSPASASVTSYPVHVQCPPLGPNVVAQECLIRATRRVLTNGPLLVQFIASREHCSRIVAETFVDGKSRAKQRLLPGEQGVPVPAGVNPGAHLVQVQATGIRGGCNTGGLAAWGGTIKVWTDSDAWIVPRGTTAEWRGDRG